MVATSHKTYVTKDGTLPIPGDILAEMGLKPGDAVYLNLDDQGVVTLHKLLTIEELDGWLPPLDHEVDPDFGNVIRAATEEAIERRLKRAGL